MNLIKMCNGYVDPFSLLILNVHNNLAINEISYFDSKSNFSSTVAMCPCIDLIR